MTNADLIQIKIKTHSSTNAGGERKAPIAAPRRIAQRYAVIDVETANAGRRSICQIGIVLMIGAQKISSKSWLVDPDGPVTLTWIHGISKEMLVGAPSFKLIYPDILKVIGNQPIVSHSSFDQQALNACTEHNQLPKFKNPWFDSVHMVCHVIGKPCPQSAALPDICRAFDIDLKHHDALSDAKAAARITAMAIEATGFPLEDLAPVRV